MILALLAIATPAVAQVTTVVPSAADPRVKRFDEPSIVVAGLAGAPLAVFLTGTWWGKYNARENTVPEIRRAYAALKLPADFHPAGPAAQNPYDFVTIRDPRYAQQCATMFGTP